jgi:hypothetical protein
METTATKSSMEPLYRPLDRTQNEIRLLRILPSTQESSASVGLEAASDIVVCELEYESMDAMEKRKESKAMLTNFMDEAVLKMVGLDVSRALEDPSIAQERQILKAMFGGIGDNDTSKSFTIAPERLASLEKQYAVSQTRMLKWLPEYFASLTELLDFEQWLQSWVWRPLSGHPEYAEKASSGYYALSYVWADAPFPIHDPDLHMVLKLAEAGGLSMKDLVETSKPKTKQIVLNGRNVEVWENLYEALRVMREVPEIQNGVGIWVDSLCIDQSNPAERSEEVKRMDQIYSKADRVITYLGPSEDHSDDVLQVIEGLGNGIRSEQAANLLDHWFQYGLDSEFFHYLTRLLTRQYWRRIWIMQEVGLASEKSLIICGMKKFSTMNVLLFGKAHARSSKEITVPNRSQPVGLELFIEAENIEANEPMMMLGALVDGVARLKNMYELRLLVETNKVELFFFNTLWFRTAAENRSTDPRDLVYGMLAILPSQLVEKIKVNYAAANTYQQVMIDFAFAHIKLYKSLHWILFRPWFVFPGSEEWPSWVPNLGLPFSLLNYSWAPAGSWNACEGLDEASIPARNEGSRLYCRGFRCDSAVQVTMPVEREGGLDKDLLAALPDILKDVTKDAKTADMSMIRKALHPPPYPMPRQEDDTTQSSKDSNVPAPRTNRYKDQDELKSALAKCFAHLGLTRADGETDIFTFPYDAIERVMLRQALFKSRYIPKDHGLFYLWRMLSHANSLELWGTKLRDLFPSANGDLADEVDNIPRFQFSDPTSQYGRMFATASGYVGVALCDLRAGDEIHILVGCAMPVALRPSIRCHGCFELLGGVFVPGLMDGEAVTEHHANEKKIGDVTLC